MRCLPLGTVGLALAFGCKAGDKPAVHDALPPAPASYANALRLHTPEPAKAAEPPPTFRIATYNINFATRDLDTVTRLILETDADVVALQETTPRNAEVLADRTQDAYPFAHFAPAKWAAGHAILSRTPLSHVALREPKHGPFGALMAVAELDGRALQVVSVHLKPTLPKRTDTRLEVLNAFVHNETVRMREIDDIVAGLDPALPHAIVGDFNTLPTLEVVTHLAALDFVDSQAQVPDHAHEPTWHWRWRGTQIALRLDYIFHGPQLATRATRVVAEGPSDHYPLVSTLAWSVVD